MGGAIAYKARVAGFQIYTRDFFSGYCSSLVTSAIFTTTTSRTVPEVDYSPVPVSSTTATCPYKSRLLRVIE